MYESSGGEASPNGFIVQHYKTIYIYIYPKIIMALYIFYINYFQVGEL